MELVDPVFVDAANAEPKKKKNVWGKWAAMAACLCLVAAGALIIEQPRTSQSPEHPDSTELEIITIPELSVGGMGFEGFLCYDVAELGKGNPWSENMNLTTLPVYENGAYDSSGAGCPTGLSENEMLNRLDVVSSALGLEVRSTETIADGLVEKDGKMVSDTIPTEICAETNNGTIKIMADGGIIYFLPGDGLALPDEYSFTHSSTTDDEAEDTLSYLADAYRDFLGFAEPRAISSGDYNFSGEFYRNYQVYDASGDDLEDILNYNFRCAGFFPNDSGNLYAITLSDWLLSAKKMGDYPVISVKEAEKRLSNGNYLTSVPAAFSGEEHIGKVELVYRAGRLEEALLPYYRFYVRLPDTLDSHDTANGLQEYGAYYVPAIKDEYIANMPAYDGSFH